MRQAPSNVIVAVRVRDFGVHPRDSVRGGVSAVTGHNRHVIVAKPARGVLQTQVNITVLDAFGLIHS